MAIANYFYNETTRRYVALFGTLFNQLKIERSNNDGTKVQSMIVPLSYAPAQKVLARLRDDPDLLNSRRTAMTLPRMSFEITSLNYDPQRKIGSTHKMTKSAKAESESSRNFVHASVRSRFWRIARRTLIGKFKLLFIAKHWDCISKKAKSRE